MHRGHKHPAAFEAWRGRAGNWQRCVSLLGIAHRGHRHPAALAFSGDMKGNLQRGGRIGLVGGVLMIEHQL